MDESSTTEDFPVVRQEGSRKVKRRLKHYNLDAIISIGYRVSSARATQFRIWATGVLRQHMLEDDRSALIQRTRYDGYRPECVFADNTQGINIP